MRAPPAALSDCEVLVCINAAWVPVVGGKLAELEQREEWESDEDWEAGYQFIAELQEALVSNCAASLSGTLQEIGVLLALALRLPADDDGYLEVILPKLGPIINQTVNTDTLGYLQPVTGNGKLARFSSEQDLLDLRGEFPADWWAWLGITEPKSATLYDIVSKLGTKEPVQVEIDGETKNLWDYITEVIGGGGDITQIAKVILDGYSAAVQTADFAADGSLQLASAVTSIISALILLDIRNSLLGGAFRLDTLGLPGANYNILDASYKILRALHPDRNYTENNFNHTISPPDTMMQALRGNTVRPDYDAANILTVLESMDTYLS